MKIFLDMDGVITDWSGGVCKLFGVDKNDPECQRILRSEYWLQGWKFGDNENVDRVVNEAGYDFWYNLELLPWANELYQMLSKYGEVVFLTSPGKFHAGAHAKLDYLFKHFENRDYVLTKHKYLCAGRFSILIDDMKKNIDEWTAHHGVPYHWPNQYLLKDSPEMLQAEFKKLEAKIIDVMTEEVQYYKKESLKGFGW